MANSAYAYDWILTGLAFDLCGGMALAKGVVVKTVRAAYLEAQPRASVNSFAVKSAIKQKAEAFVGGFLLSLGFALQMFGNLHGGPAANDLGRINSPSRLVLMLLGTAAASVGLVKLSHLWARRRFYIYFARNFRTDSAPLTHQGQELDALGLLYDTERRPRESDAEYRSRLESRRLLVGARYAGRERDMPEATR